MYCSIQDATVLYIRLSYLGQTWLPLDFQQNLGLFELVQVLVSEAEYSARVLSADACQTEAVTVDCRWGTGVCYELLFV